MFKADYISAHRSQSNNSVVKISTHFCMFPVFSVEFTHVTVAVPWYRDGFGYQYHGALMYTIINSALISHIICMVHKVLND